MNTYFLVLNSFHREALLRRGILKVEDRVIYPFSEFVVGRIENLVIFFEEKDVQKVSKFKEWFCDNVLSRLSPTTSVKKFSEVDSPSYQSIFTPTTSKTAYLCIDPIHTRELTKRGVIPEGALVIYPFSTTLGLRFDRLVICFDPAIKEGKESYNEWFREGVLPRFLPDSKPLSDRITALGDVHSYHATYPKEKKLNEHRMS